MSFFVTGTDTGVGKTHTVIQILQRYRAVGKRAAGMKPLCCGDRDDVTRLLAAGCDGLTVDEINPIWLRTPAAPLVAARKEGYEFKIEAVLEAFRSLQARVPTVIVEGVGGWQVPIAPGCNLSDLARTLALPVLIVAQNRLGCLNHAILTLDSVRAAGLDCPAIILNEFKTARDFATTTNQEVLRELCGIPVVAGGAEESGLFSDELDAILGL